MDKEKTITDGLQTQEIPDRIGKYLTKYLGGFLFDELQEAYLKKTGFYDILSGVQIPIKTTDLTGLTNVKIAQNMAFVIGADINFNYKDSYIAYILKNFAKGFDDALIGSGVKAAEKGEYEQAAIFFRAAMLINPDNGKAFFGYGRACADAYQNKEQDDAHIDEYNEYVARFKAEALEAFEKTTIKDPDFAEGYYFLGYAYLNLGLYIKAKLTWDDFIKLTDNAELKEEIYEWQEKLQEPVKIEEGYNMVLAGKFQEGIEVLFPYTTDDRFNTWWPLWYYIGFAYNELADLPLAEVAMKRVLMLSPSNTDAMDILTEIYKKTGDKENAEKYSRKSALVKAQLTEEQFS